jgi:superfamily II DNA or RNA helicase
MRHIMDKDSLLQRVIQLEAENEKLRKMLRDNGISLEPQLHASIGENRDLHAMATETNRESTKLTHSKAEKEGIINRRIALFRNLFMGREDVFAHRWQDKTGRSGYQPVCVNEWNRDLCDKRKFKCAVCPNRKFKSIDFEDIYNHLAGRQPLCKDVIGAYAILPDDTCRFLCADFDDKNCTHGYKNDVRAYVGVCSDFCIPYSVERSRSGNGAHVWIFFSSPITAVKARRLGNTVLTEAMRRDGKMSFKSYDRFFPNQDHLPEGGFGNLVALPLQGKARREGNSVFVDESFVAYPDQWAYLAQIKRITECEVDDILARYGSQQDFGELASTSESHPWEPPKPLQLSSEDFPQQLSAVKANMIYIPLTELRPKLLNHLKRIASFKNPEFFRRQNMRLSTYNVPRIISCAEITDDYLALPRGCEDEILSLLSQHTSINLTDKTSMGQPISVQFNGTLRENQQRALEALTTHNNGILSATTAFGKTVVGAALIAHHRVNTLILVHTKALLDQWEKQLSEFLHIDYPAEVCPKGRGRRRPFSIFGSLCTGQNSLHGIVDIALIQSCNPEDIDLLHRYGMVIVDECHHVSAVHFEQVLKQCNAHYVYGLTATPIRKDGHQPIIFMQCGPIRYMEDAKTQMMQQSFERYFYPRFTSYRQVEGESMGYAQCAKALSENKARNELIIADVKKALNEHRTPLVLTTRTDHARLLADSLQPCCKNVIVLVGSQSRKEKLLAMDRLHAIPQDQPLVIIATGKYIGEGFDYPRLDTLFLAMPVSWTGLMQQYAGRLHRECNGKTDVRIYDYVDLHVSVFETMYRRRMKSYAKMGYQLLEPTLFNPMQLSSPVLSHAANLYYGTNYTRRLAQDICNAKQSIIIVVPSIRISHSSAFIDALRQKSLQGISVAFYTRKEQPEDNLNLPVVFNPRLSLNAVIIDRHIVWYGTVNFFGSSNSADSVMCVADAQLATDMVGMIASR